MKKFNEVVEVSKLTACKTCETYIYKLKSCRWTVVLESYLLPFGTLAYPLSHVKIISMDNDYVAISQARIGGNKLKVKFKKESDKYKQLFDIQIAAFVSEELDLDIEI